MISIVISGYSQLVEDLPSLYAVDTTKEIKAQPAMLPDSYIATPHLPSSNPLKPSLLKDAKVGLEVGSSFSSFGSGRSMFTTYLSPSVTFQPSQRMQVYVGAYVSQNNASGFKNDDVVAVAQPVAGYSGATYFLTDRMNLFGNGIYGRGGYAITPYGINNSYKSISVGVSYKISEKASISAQFQVSQGLAPYGSYFGSNPFSRFQNTFGNNSLFEPNRP